jgi:tRNA A37 threonylcarbamoyladenosine modification protein TsaB
MTTAAPAGSLDHVTEIEGPRVGDPASLLTRWGSLLLVDQPITIVGDATPIYADTIAMGLPVAQVTGLPPLAGTIGLLAVQQHRAGLTIDPAAVRPLYVRRPDAEVERERRALDVQRVK